MENPQLHLVWFYDQIFVKPIPRYLLSYAFWQYLSTQSDVLQQSVVGFVRTYSHLIRYESDFRIATRECYGLIPDKDGEEPITWESFATFIGWFDKVADIGVNPRYHYGELRLTRLNFITRLFLGKLTFHHMHAQWGPFLGQLFTPLLSLFAILSITLSAMQVGLASEPVVGGSTASTALPKVSHVMSILVLILAASLVVCLSCLIIFMFSHDIWFARLVMKENKANMKSQARYNRVMKSGVV